jgi:hypothetical protein
MIEQGTIQQRQLEEQISFLQLTLASLQARQNTSLDLVDGPMPNGTVTPEAGATLLDMPLPIAAG